MKSLDLKSVNVQVLNDDELRLVDGGDCGIGILVAVVLYVLSEWDDISAGYSDGANGNGYNYQP